MTTGWTRCEAVDFNGARCDLMAGHVGAHLVLDEPPVARAPAPPAMPPGSSPAVKERMNQNQKFALLVFALILLVGVVFVYLQIQGGLNAMI